jgi:spermidine synthase
MRNALGLCFALSGTSALAIEMLWVRSAGITLGATAATTATVLAWYFAGLGIGAAAARQTAGVALRRYALLELGAAAAILWSIAVFAALGSGPLQAWLAGREAALGTIAVGVAILPATICMGATLPVLAQALVLPGSAGRGGGLLYALNTLGGAIGIGLAGFGLPAWIGARASMLAAAGGSALAGFAALLIARLQSKSQALPRAAPAARRVAVPWSPVPRLRTVAAATGALGLSLEVLWTRLFAQVLHNSTYSFAAVALVMVLALAAGAFASALALRRFTPTRLAAASLAGAALATTGGFWLFVDLTDGFSYFGMSSGLFEYLSRIVALAAATAAPAMLLSGAVLPALWAALDDPGAVARPIGDLSAANTFGGIAGALLAGFVAVPLVGVRVSVLVVAVGYGLLAQTIAPGEGWLRPIAALCVLVVVIAAPSSTSLVHLGAADTLRALYEGSSGIVGVVESEGDLQLRLDNYYVLGGSAAERNERRQGLIPLLLHPDPKQVAFIGVATGISASAALALGVDRTTAIELVPEVAYAARRHFARWNDSLLERPDVRLVIGDGRRELAAASERFDVIVSDLFIPWHAGAGNLYAREMYAMAARRLAPGGLFCQWLPLYQLTREEFGVIARTFLDVFPESSLWRNDFYPDRPVAALVGGLGPARIDPARLEERLARLPAWSRDPLLASPRGFFMLYVGNLRPSADLFAGAPINRDDRPLIEFQAPLLTRVGRAGDKDWFVGDALASFFETVAARSQTDADALLADSSEVAQARRAGLALHRYALAATRGDASDAARYESEVRSLVPEVVLAAESAPEPARSAAEQQLSELRAEQKETERRLEAMEGRLRALVGAERSDR